MLPATRFATPSCVFAGSTGLACDLAHHDGRPKGLHDEYKRSAVPARRLLRQYATHHEPDIAYYTLLAEAEGKAGSEAEAHIALAEAYYLSGETGHARERLKFAQRSSQVDRYQRQRIESRLKEIERELEEEKNEKRFKF